MQVANSHIVTCVFAHMHIVYLNVLLLPFTIYVSHKLLKMMCSKLCVLGNSQLEAIGTMQYNAFIVESISVLCSLVYTSATSVYCISFILISVFYVLHSSLCSSSACYNVVAQ